MRKLSNVLESKVFASSKIALKFTTTKNYFLPVAGTKYDKQADIYGYYNESSNLALLSGRVQKPKIGGLSWGITFLPHSDKKFVATNKKSIDDDQSQKLETKISENCFCASNTENFEMPESICFCNHKQFEQNYSHF